MLTYNGLNQLSKIEEKLASVVKATTTLTYNENGAPLTTSHPRQSSEFTYDTRDLVEQVKNTEAGAAAEDHGLHLHQPRSGEGADQAQRQQVVHDYHLDGSVAAQVEKKSGGALVAQHALDYNANGHRVRDASKIQNADNATAYLDEARDYDFDPRDRLRKVTKKRRPAPCWRPRTTSTTPTTTS